MWDLFIGLMIATVVIALGIASLVEARWPR